MANTPEDRMRGFPARDPLICTCPDRHGPPDPKCPIHTTAVTRDQFGMRTLDVPKMPEISLPDMDVKVNNLDYDEEIRSWALDAASRVYAGGRGGHTYEDAIIEMAKRFEKYLREGS